MRGRAQHAAVQWDQALAAAQPPRCSHTRCFFWPRSPARESRRVGPLEEAGGDPGRWMLVGQRRTGPTRGSGPGDGAKGPACGDGGTADSSCWRPFASLYPKPTEVQPAASCAPIFPATLPRGCASRPSAGAGDCCRTRGTAMPAVAAGLATL